LGSLLKKNPLRLGFLAKSRRIPETKSGSTAHNGNKKQLADVRICVSTKIGEQLIKGIRPTIKSAKTAAAKFALAPVDIIC
jgi:hypothetical protein